ncbi:MAG: hypothetical protein CPSOU_2277 [uncultured Paraburkholderia sp.]|nr:MAG: hypothetical protein CPSOU_2277 [uncultured Paraburkholderia sp.]
MRAAPSPRFVCRTGAPGSSVAPPCLSEEAAAIVAGRTLPVRTVQALQRMSPAQQRETLSLMVRQENLSGDFARALLAATPPAKRIDHGHSAQLNPASARQLGRTVEKLTAAQRDVEALLAHHHENLVFVTLAAGWARTWIHDEVIADWLASRHPEYAAVLDRAVSQADISMAPGRHMKLAYEVVTGIVATSKGKKRRRRRINKA